MSDKSKKNTSFPYSSKEGNPSGVIKLLGQTQLPEEFITPGKSFEEALAKTTIRDQNQLYNIILLYQQLDSFDEVTSDYPRGIMYEEKCAIINLLIGFNAIDGFNKSFAAMTHTGIYLPEGAGIKLSKEANKALDELRRERVAQKSREDQAANV